MLLPVPTAVYIYIVTKSIDYMPNTSLPFVNRDSDTFCSNNGLGWNFGDHYTICTRVQTPSVNPTTTTTTTI